MNVRDVNYSRLKLDAMREVAISRHCPAEAYYHKGDAPDEEEFLLGGWKNDVELSRSICKDLGVLSLGDLTIAAFEIDESIIIVRVEDLVVTTEVREV